MWNRIRITLMNWLNRFRIFMIGRNGSDQFNFALLIAYLVLSVFSSFFIGIRIVYAILICFIPGSFGGLFLALLFAQCGIPQRKTNAFSTGGTPPAMPSSSGRTASPTAITYTSNASAADSGFACRKDADV